MTDRQQEQMHRQKVWGKHHERVDLSPQVRKLLHRQARNAFGLTGPLILGGGFVATTFFYFIPQENRMLR